MPHDYFALVIYVVPSGRPITGSASDGSGMIGAWSDIEGAIRSLGSPGR